MIENFRELDVYQKSFDLALKIHRASEKFPKSEQFGLTDQIRRASKSICANIAEGFAKQKASKAEFKRFLMMVYGSANEVQVWIDFCKEFSYLSAEEARTYFEEYESIRRMLASFHSKA